MPLYTIHGRDKDQIMRLTYIVDEEFVVTSQPSQPLGSKNSIRTYARRKAAAGFRRPNVAIRTRNLTLQKPEGPILETSLVPGVLCLRHRQKRTLTMFFTWLLSRLFCDQRARGSDMLSAIRATLSIQAGSYIHKRSIWCHRGSKAQTENH